MKHIGKSEKHMTEKEELRMLRERLGPKGIEIVLIDERSHYVNHAVKVEIDRLRAENEHFRKAIVAATTCHLPS